MKTIVEMAMHGIIFLTIMRAAGFIAGAKMGWVVFQTSISDCVLHLLCGMVKMLF